MMLLMALNKFLPMIYRTIRSGSRWNVAFATNDVPRHVWGSMHGVNGKHPDNTAFQPSSGGSFGTSVRFNEESMFG